MFTVPDFRNFHIVGRHQYKYNSTFQYPYSLTYIHIYVSMYSYICFYMRVNIYVCMCAFVCKSLSFGVRSHYCCCRFCLALSQMLYCCWFVLNVKLICTAVFHFVCCCFSVQCLSEFASLRVCVCFYFACVLCIFYQNCIHSKGIDPFSFQLWYIEKALQFAYSSLPPLSLSDSL